MPKRTASNGRRWSKPSYRVTNWPEYDRALRRRGDVTVWMSTVAIAGWLKSDRLTAGGKLVYTDLAIETVLTVRTILHLPLRQAESGTVPITPKRARATVVRAAKPYWTHRPTSGEGAVRYGGRFNPVDVQELCASFTFNTCACEVRFSQHADPYTFYFLDVDCRGGADLSDNRTCSDLSVS